MDGQLAQIALPTLSTILSGAVLLYVKWTREDVQAAVKSINDVKADVSKNTGRLSHLEQFSAYHQKGTDARLGAVSARASDLSGDIDKLTRTIELCPNCPQPGRKP